MPGDASNPGAPSDQQPHSSAGVRMLKHRLQALVAAVAALLAAMAAFPVSAQTPAPSSRFVVVLDAAHGGDDTGARLSNEAEKYLTLALSVKLRSLLAARGFAVVTTRESDTNLDPDRRAEIANHANAQACLSLHATSSGAGVHLFVSSLAPKKDARFAAWKTAQSASVMSSLSLAGMLNSALTHAGIPITLGRTDLPGIDSMTCPAVAVEVAPSASTDTEAAASVDDPGYQARVADAIAAALVEWRSQAKEGGQP